MKADYLKDYGAFQERIDAMNERVQAMEKKKRIVPYKRRSRNEIGLLEVVLDDPDDPQPLEFYFNKTKKLNEYIRKNRKPFSSITHKYGIDIESQLSFLADFIRKNLNDPSKCGYVVAIQFVSIDEFHNSFLPTNKHLTSTRKGRNSKKDVFHTSFQSLFKVGVDKTLLPKVSLKRVVTHELDAADIVSPVGNGNGDSGNVTID
uniref:DUF4806 domain-containing protein n=1 Tax=Panagrellus redivivus TaxID=6233 RepID=A0A7E4ZZ01_PANRE